ncbi:MAG: tRNA (guanine(46)-N(7))-methyltransferase TrmB [Candidatus Binataceae bacterium]
MARLRKAAKIWRQPESRRAADSALFAAEGAVFMIDLQSIFSRTAPIEIEIGAGKGDFVAARAAEFPDRNFLAVELSGVVSRMLAVRCGRAGLANLRVVRMDARTLVNLMLPAGSISAYHVYFPDPWPKERHHKHRLFTPYLGASLKRTLVSGGALYVATDVAQYADDIFAMLGAGGMARSSEPVPGCDRTGFGRRFAAAGKAVYARAYRKL